ncbi:MAG: hypothetical protein KBS74_04700 [Clostridiales bacterium]|nr:hypothetical protein [Candidatus Cacconaster stercorequi]
MSCSARAVSVSLSFGVDFGAVFACISFAYDNSAYKTGFSCSSRFSYRSSIVNSANACSNLIHCFGSPAYARPFLQL